MLEFHLFSNDRKTNSKRYLSIGAQNRVYANASKQQATIFTFEHSPSQERSSYYTANATNHGQTSASTNLYQRWARAHRHTANRHRPNKRSR